MGIYSVADITLADIKSTEYDMAFVASGYEDRCTYLSTLVAPDQVVQRAVLSFEGLRDGPSRESHDKFLGERWGTKPVVVSSEDDAPVYAVLNGLARGGHDQLKILVDYSSMSRLWYAAVLNWARLGGFRGQIIVDLAYSVGQYEAEPSPMVIHEMLAVPGCEGGTIGLGRSIAAFGLGSNGWASLCVLERVEADTVFAYVADPGATSDYGRAVIRKNKDFLSESRVEGDVLRLPLRSVATSYRHLAELIAPHLPHDVVALVPMGPKPHVLASMLVAMRFRAVACLRVSAKRDRPESISATGEVIASRITVVGR